MSEPLVSVIVPTKDRPETLRRALASVAAQTLGDVEAVVVNDGGCDVSHAVAELPSLAVTTIVHEVPRERSNARNAGIAAARGRYLAYLDDDDVYLPDHLETLVAAVRRSGCRVAYSDARRELIRTIDGRPVVVSSDVPYSVDFDRDRLRYENYIPIICLLHEAACLDEVGGGFDGSVPPLEDWELFVRLSARFDFVHVPTVTARFEERVDGTRGDFLGAAERLFAKHPETRPDLLRLRGGYLAGLRALAARPPAASRPLTTIVIPTYGNVELTRQCLDAIARTTEPGTYEVVVVDNGSTDGTPAFLREAEAAGRLRAIPNTENHGFARACNQGLAAARGELVLFLNNDTIPHPGWLEALAAAAAEPEVGVVGAKLLYADGTIQHAGIAVREADGEPWPFHRHLCHAADAPYASRPRDLQMVTGACLLIRRDLGERLGGFDERFWNGHEDLDLCLRVREAGFRVVYEPRCVVTHLESQTKRLLGLERFELRQGVDNEESRGRALFLERWRDRIEIDEPRLRAEDGLVRPEEALHVLFTMYGWQHEGGGTILPRQIAKALVRRGHRVTVVSAAPERRPDLPAYGLAQRVDEGVRVIELFNRPTVFYAPDRPELEADDPTARAALAGLVAQLGPDVVHYHSLVGFSLAAPRDVDALGVPSVFTSHNYWPICPRMYLFRDDLSPCAANGGSCECGSAHAARAAVGREVFASAVDRHLAVSHRVKELYVENGHDAERIEVLHQQPQTVEWLWEAVGSRREPVTTLDRPLRVGFIGSALPHKGVHVLAAALQKLPAGSVECIVFGGGPDAYVEALRGIDAAGVLRFHGGYETHELPELLASVDVCVVPSVWEDCAPLVVAEALAARLPVVGSRAGGIPDFVEDGATGFLFPLGDADALAAALRRFLDDPELLGRMQAAIPAPRGFDAYLDDLVAAYRSVIAERRRIPGARRFAVVASAGDVIRDGTLLRAFAEAFAADDDATLVLHAAGAEVPALEAAIAAAGLDREDGPDMLAVVDGNAEELESKADAVLRTAADASDLRRQAESRWAA